MILSKEEERKIQDEINMLQKKIADSYKEEYQKTLNERKCYVGKTYKMESENGREYYKVIRLDEDNIYRAYCIGFNTSPIDEISIKHEDCLIVIENVGLGYNNDDFIEISKEEYDTVFKEFTNKIKEL